MLASLSWAQDTPVETTEPPPVEMPLPTAAPSTDVPPEPTVEPTPTVEPPTLSPTDEPTLPPTVEATEAVEPTPEVTALPTVEVTPENATEAGPFSVNALVSPLEVTNTNDSGEGSLRAAIEYANSNPGADTITFNIPGDGPYTIQPQTPLPEIFDPVTIDGLSQPGASCANWPPTLKIEIQGSLVFGANMAGNANNSLVRGLVINHGGIAIDTSGVVIQCNFIGTDVTGTLARDGTGIFIESGDILIGGIGPGTRNLISGNENAIYGEEGTGSYLTVQGNYIGTDVTGQFAVGNTGSAIFLDSADHMTIGGTEPGAGNLISGNGRGINITFDSDFGFQNTAGYIQGNYIGTDVTGTKAIPNGSGIGVGIIPVLIGGTEPGARNLISGNIGCGVGAFLESGSGMIIQGNFIGTDITGTKALGNGCGVHTGGGVDIIDNLISGNNGPGAIISLNPELGDVLDNNIIGTDVTGTQPLGNLEAGVVIELFADFNFAATWVSNLIAYNGGAGVAVVGSPNTVVDYSIGGRIFANGGLGIDILNDGVTPNDPGDADGNLWGLQNYPVLNPIVSGSTAVSGTLNSIPNEIFDIDIYANTECDPSGFGEGETFLGRGRIVTDAAGNAVFNITVPALQAGQYITATARSGRATSEFSACVQVTAGGAPAPKLRYPNSNGTVSMARTAFSWFAVPNVRRYQLQVATDPNFANIVVDRLEANTATAPFTFLPGAYYWRVRAQDLKNVWGPFSEVRYYEFVVMQSPIDNGHSFGAFPIFTWNQYPGVRRYQLEIDNNPDFSSPEFVCMYTSKVYSSRPCGPDGLAYGDHYWRVNIDLGNGFLPSPIYWAISVNIRNMPVPQPISPIGSVQLDLPSLILFRWSAATGTQEYQVQISRDPRFRDHDSGFFTNDTEDLAGMFSVRGQYYWRVRAWFNGKPGLWATARFEIP